MNLTKTDDNVYIDKNRLENKGNNMKRFAFISILFAFLLWYLPLVSPTPIDEISSVKSFGNTINLIKYVLYNYRTIIGLICVAIISISSIKEIREFRKPYQAIIHNQLSNIMDFCFRNKKSLVRVTVFRRVRWSEAFFLYLYHAYIKSRREMLFRSKNCFTKIKNIPIPFSSYLTIFTRIGEPDETVYSTMFRIDEDYGVEGIVGLAWDNKNPGKVFLPNLTHIENIESCTNLDSIEDGEVRDTIKEYMKKGNISSFNKLRSLNRFPVAVWAKLINDPANNKWGVIVIDSTTEELIKKMDTKKVNQHTREIQRILKRNYPLL